jgi:hypothetical protein
MKLESKWGGFWFEYLEFLGENTRIIIGRLDEQGKVISERPYSHAEHDGYSALVNELERSGQFSRELLPEARVTSAPPTWQIWREFFRYMLRLPIRSPGLALVNRDYIPDGRLPKGHAHHIFSFVESQEIKMRAQELKLGVNFYLLACLDATFIPYLQKGDEAKKRTWMVPISLRDGSQSAANTPGNITGFIDVDFSTGSSVQESNQRWRRDLKAGAAWAGHLGFHIGQFTGPSLLKLIIRMNPFLQRRMGVYSHMGSWGPADGDTKKGHWFGFPPVVEYQPISAISLEWHGRIGINLMLHPALSEQSHLVNELILSWAEKARSGVIF